MKQLIIFIMMIPLAAAAQSNGIHFEHGLSWDEAVAKAKSEHKYIFMDCFTTWCGPCKYMSQVIFTKDSVGEFFNSRFVSVKAQLDTTAGDNEEVKSWYTTSHNIAVTYKVNVYPTFLFFDENGNPVHRMAGGGEAEEFIERSSKALDTSYQYYTLLHLYESGNRDTGVLHRLIISAKDAYQMETASNISADYFNTQTNLYTRENLELMRDLTLKSSDKNFEFFRKNASRIDNVLGKGAAEQQSQSIILREEVYPYFSNNISATPDWTTIQKAVAKKYPAESDEVMAKSKVIWYQYAKNWNEFQKEVVAYMSKYGHHAQAGELNEYAWSVFQNCDDAACINMALEWSKRSFAENNDPAFMDTYANILYKLGKKDEAVTWEEKALSLADESSKPGYQETIDKMKRGEKTWN